MPPPPQARTAPSGAPFLAADVGGTHVRVGLVAPSGPAGRAVSVLHYRTYACAEHPGLADILAGFLGGLPDAGAGVDEAVVACAGYALDDGSLIAANLPWPVSLPAIGARLGLSRLHAVNDFQAVAHAPLHADAEELLHLSGPRDAPPGPTLVVGPGTGLGAAVRIPGRHGATVLATEAGQAALTAGNPLEMEVLRLFQAARRHVPIEHALSGPGLMHLYAALSTVSGRPGAGHASPGEITAAACNGRDPLAHDALDMFCGLLGSTVGDMALLYGVHGGIFLAGGILPRIRRFLAASAFVERFLDKGPMREVLARIPVRLIDHGQLGVIGAAGWYLARKTEPREAASPAS